MAVGVGAQIRAAIWMTLWAVGLGPVAYAHGGVLRGVVTAVSGGLLRFQMARPHAAASPAGVVQVLARWDGSVLELPSDPVCLEAAHSSVLSFRELTVASVVYGAKPEPTSGASLHPPPELACVHKWG